ncbi:sensor histidine kinase [Anaerotignum sp.]|uniref:sensor histidine kinase n=1 Tax=Anaerotignum sp. TaxID=2039241 RepID=UPI0028AF5BA2|nr:HAMP domain-containing sensor histidine kinase [Anaerotignum sp.]
MKFFWKVFLSIILITVLFFSIGVYYIIHSSFKYSLSREVTAAYEENDIILYTLTNEMQSNSTESPLSKNEEIISNEQWVMGIANSVIISNSKGIVPFRISNSSYNSLYESKWADIDNTILKKLPNDARGYEITFANEEYYIHTAAPIILQGEKMYVETCRNITPLFKNRDMQYQICFYLMLIMIVFGAIIIFAVTSWLTGPIRKLSSATKRFAEGEFHQRVTIKGNDELAMLSQDFNMMAENLEETVDELKEAARRQETFVNNFTHELKTPLTSIIGYADMIRSKKMNPDLIVESANYIFQEGKRLEALSLKLMNIIILKNQTFEFQNVNATDLFESIEGAYRPIFNKVNIEFTVSYEDAVISIEPDLIKTVCVNLLDNSIKSIAENGRISLIGKKSDNGYSISIYDNGRGMEASEITKITEAFYMIDKSRAREQGGAGLGLSICAEILKLHGGTLTFKSTPQKGTCATFDLKGGNGT